MKRNFLTLIIGAALILVFGLLLFTFQVRQTEVAVVTTFGQPTRPINKPGLNFKLPWPFQKVYKFDQRIQTFEDLDKFSQDLTSDGNTLITMLYVGWRITDPQVFFPKFAGGSTAEARKMLESLVRNAKGVVVGRHALSDFINADEKKLKFDAIEAEIKALVQAQLQTNNCGIQVEFLGLKRIGLPEGVTQTVFERMTSERNVLAARLESEGKAEASKIQFTAERKAAEMISRAESEAHIILGQGEAVAAETLAVFQQNPELANFIVGLKALEAATKDKTTLILDSRTPPFNLLNGVGGKAVEEMTGMNNENQTNRPVGVDAGSQALVEALRSSFSIIKVVMILLVLGFVANSFFQVGPREKAVILRFGRPLGEGDKALLGSGAHWAFPYPIDEIVRVPITEIQQVKSTVGWFAQTPEQEIAGIEPPVAPNSPINPLFDGYALTGDGNIVHVKATLSYRIDDPIRYVFGFVSGSNAVQNALDNALLATTARFKVDDILTRDRIGFQDAVRGRVAQLAQAQNLGIIVDQCVVTPRHPRQLNLAFENVLNAGVNRDKALNEARSAANQLLNKSGADAAGRLETAQAESTRLIQAITSDADTFRRLLPKYEANRDLFIQQRLVETMGRALTNADEKVFLAERADGKPREFRLMLNRELKTKPNPRP